MAIAPKIIIRPVIAEDYTPWLGLWRGYLEFYQVQLSETLIQTTWARFLDPSISLHAAVVSVDAKLLGLVHYVFHPSTWGRQDYCYLEDLFVCATARGQGLATQLIQHVQAQAQLKQCSRLYWHTQSHNQSAIMLYDRLAQPSGMIEYRMPLLSAPAY
jgi:GNAT superfamily N-acetyltransferase